MKPELKLIPDDPAKTAVIDPAEALHSAVARVLKTLRKGKTAKLPGIGTIQPGRKWVLRTGRNDR